MSLEYHVGKKVVGDWEIACGIAIERSISRGESVNIDVVLYDVEDADKYGGDDAVDKFNSDPEASVFERFVITAKSLGQVP